MAPAGTWPMVPITSGCPAWPISRICRPVRSCRSASRWTLLTSGQVASRRSEEHTSELQSLMRISYAVFCLKKKQTYNKHMDYHNQTIKHKYHTYIYTNKSTNYTQ